MPVCVCVMRICVMRVCVHTRDSIKAEMKPGKP